MQATVKDDKFYEDSAQALRTAMKGLGTDDETLINTVFQFTRTERQKLKTVYKASFGRDLIKDIEGDTSHNYKRLLVALFEDPIEYDAKCLYESMHGLGTDDKELIEVVCTRTNEQLAKIKDKFQELYKKDLIKYVEGDTSGHYKKFLVSLLQCNRSTNATPDEEKMNKDVEDLYNAGENKCGTDEDMFNKIFALRSPEEIKRINTIYEQKYKHPLCTVIDKEFSGNIKEALKAALEGILTPAHFFAERAYKAIKGLGTDDKTLIRVLVTREDIDIPEIAQQYLIISGKAFVEAVRGDTSGNYRKSLLKLIDTAMARRQ